jgi:hypothetical protein
MIDRLPQTVSTIMEPLSLAYSGAPSVSREPDRPYHVVRPARFYGGSYAYSVRTANVVAPSSPESDTISNVAEETLASAARRLKLLLSLPANWDSYGAKPIQPGRAAAALNLLWLFITNKSPVPAIIPTSDGGIQLEWHRCGVDLEIAVLSGTAFAVFFEDRATGEIWEGELGNDLRPLRPFIDRLKNC